MNRVNISKKTEIVKLEKNIIGNYMQSTRNNLQIQCQKWVEKKEQKRYTIQTTVIRNLEWLY